MKAFYVTMLRGQGQGQRVAWLLGPFAKHESALAMVEKANARACEVDARAHWDAFGTASIEKDQLAFRDGVLNKDLLAECKATGDPWFALEAA